MVIELKDLRFHAHHGVYEEETVSGGEFLVNAIIQFRPEHLPVSALSDTVNYVEVYQLIAARMQSPEALLEKLAYTIGEDILKLDDKILSVETEVLKLHPPIIQFNGKVGVKVTVKR